MVINSRVPFPSNLVSVGLNEHRFLSVSQAQKGRNAINAEKGQSWYQPKQKKFPLIVFFLLVSNGEISFFLSRHRKKEHPAKRRNFLVNCQLVWEPTVLNSISLIDFFFCFLAVIDQQRYNTNRDIPLQAHYLELSFVFVVGGTAVLVNWIPTVAPLWNVKPTISLLPFLKKNKKK